MADKRLIDNESSTTVDKFYGNKGGKDVQIPLADAAAVLADIKDIAPTDFNNVSYNTTNTLFVATQNALNAPFDGMIRGFLLNFIQASYCAQIYIDCNIKKGTAFLRTRLHDRTWTSWRKITTTDV